MIYICEKCNMVYSAEIAPSECDSCGCTYIRKADDREIADILGSILLNTDESVLLKEERGGKQHR